VIELCRRQLDFGDGLIAEEVADLWEDWMRHVDAVLEDPALLDVVYAALACRWKNSRTRGRRGTPVDVVFGCWCLPCATGATLCSSARCGRTWCIASSRG
jgi:hypothetical protein